MLGFLISRLTQGYRFLKRSIRVRLVLTPIDRHSPFDGPVGNKGFASFELTQMSLTALQDLLEQSTGQAASSTPRVRLAFGEEQALKELFETVEPMVTQYLGSGAYLDCIDRAVSKTEASKSISANWHTDNVGNRLEVFVCIFGDGSQPTVIVPSANRIPSVGQHAKNTANELMRWLGFKFDKSFNDEIAFHHSSGTVFIFDIQLLQRGGYESSEAERVVFHMEFSSPKKHPIAFGPIGSTQLNCFTFDSSLLNIRHFAKVLDPEWLQQISGRTYSYGPR